MELKETLNLPDPDFTIPMKADLPMREPQIQAQWDALDVYGLIERERAGAPRFLLHDGPPYTNGPIHIGTGLNKILKDFVLRSRLMMGYRCPYVPGFDNHGLPIEQAVLAKFHEKKVTPSLKELRQACRDHAKTYVELQTRQFKRLGVYGMWDKPYCTMDYRFEAGILRVFKRLVEKGFVYRGLRPTLWSPTAQTALADTEIVYKDVVSKSIYVRFPLKAPWPLFEGLDNVNAVIWTTTPWTIPANLALAFHPEHEYAVVSVGDDHYVVLGSLVEKVAGVCGWSGWEVVRRFRGREVEGAVFRHPIIDRESLAVLADYVTTEDGTGVVHTAPGHGRDDFFTGAKYGLPVLCPVDGRGMMTEEAGEFAGLYYKKSESAVIERLREAGALLAVGDYEHSYPHAERDNNPVIFRATEQWFVSIDHDGLREKALDQTDHQVEWFPRSGHTRFRSMIANRPDWCVSRQRPWGAGIPVFYGKESGVPVLDPVAIEAVAQLVEREGSDAWYETEPSKILPEGYRHPETGETEFTKETDVFDVWFDSGSSHTIVLEGDCEPAWKEELPSDVNLEGSDQHRGWFNLSMIIGTALRGVAPYRAVVTHGMVNDEHGQKMSKRLGNVVDPVEVCDKYGADVLRYWAASVNYEDDMPCSDQLLKVAGEGYRRIRNTLRFMLSNLYDFDPGVAVDLRELDQWVVEKTDGLVESVILELKKYQFNDALSLIHNFCVNELSAFYLDAVKDRLYCDGSDWPSRRSTQKACHYVLFTLVKLIAPFLPHTAEEVYQRIPLKVRKPTVFLESLEPTANVIGSPLHERFDKLLESRQWVFSAFEEWKKETGAKDSQSIQVRLTADAETVHLLESFGDELPIFFKMAGVELVTGERKAEFWPSEWFECQRSRLYRPDVQPVSWNGSIVNLTARDRAALGVG
jgi:isoleucyl-tRNA synthetase